MGRKQATTETKELVRWDEELAAAAKAAQAAAAQAGGGGNFISIKGGVLSVDGNPVPNNALAGVVVDFVMENKFFASDYDPDSPTPPSCYAFGRTKEEMGPHDEAEDKQSEQCEGCPQNEFGTSDRGRGKACKNTYRLLVLPAGELDREGRFSPPEGPEDLKGPLYSLSVPPTSLKAFGGYVKQLSGNLRPPWAVFTLIRIVPDPKTQVAVTFESLGNAATELLTQLRARHVEGERTIETPYPKAEEMAKRAKPAKAAPRGKGPKRRF